MYTVLIIEGDPTYWYLEHTSAAAIAQQLSQPDPVSLPVVCPLVGDLIVSPRAAGSVAILDRPPTVSWMPSGIKAPTAILYVPSAAGPTTQFPGYELPGAANIDTLKQDIMAAMKDGKQFTANASTAIGDGVVILDGAALSFAVVCPVTQ